MLFVKPPDPKVDYFVHEPTRSLIPVYKRIGPSRRLIIRLCFGLKYEKIK